MIINTAIASGAAKEFDEYFDYFSRDIVVHKEPKKIITSPQTAPIFGYDAQPSPAQYTYMPQFQTFKARISYNKKQSTESIQEIQFSVTQGSVTIVVKEDAKNYIENNKTIKIEFDGKAFKLASTPAVRRFLTKTYYQYFLEETK
jgi:hypothetical protein